MPRYYYSDSIDIDAIALRDGADDEDRKKIREALIKHHPAPGRISREAMVVKDGQVFIKKPGMYCKQDEKGNPIPELLPFEPKSISFGIPGYGFYVVPPGGHVDVDYTVSEKYIKDNAPHLLTEAEYLLREGAKKQKAAPPKQ